MRIFDTETLARELGADSSTKFEIAEAHFAANPGNNYIALGMGSKSEDEVDIEKPFRLHLARTASDPAA